MKLRPYQRTACASAHRGLETAHTLLESPTGTGKTEMAIAISEKAVQRVAGPVLVVAPTDEIYGQMITRYQRAGWMVHADKAERHARPSMAMEQALDGLKVVVVASLGTIAIRDRIERYPREGWALPLMDECFPAGTLVDGRPIESLRVGDIVRSYNHVTGMVERRPVARTFSSTPTQMVTVYLSTGRRVICTAGHPFYVGSSYRAAALLQPGDAVYGTSQSSYMQGVQRNGHPRKHQGEPRATANRRCLLFGDLQAHLDIQEALGHDGRHQPAACKREDAGAQSNAETGCSFQGERVAPSHGPRSTCAGWKRTRTDGDGEPPARSTAAGVEGQSHCSYLQATQCWLSNALQAGPCLAEPSTRSRGGRRKPLRDGEAGAGCEEDGLSPVAWVDRVEVHERRGADGFGALCSDDRVYNIEVAGNHNYFVDGILVHNCHHAPAATWQGVREYFDQPWLGLSATPEREGMARLWPNHVHAFAGGLQEAIDEGWLVPYAEHYKYLAGFSQDDYEALKSEDAREVDPALHRAVRTLVEDMTGRQGVAFWPRTRAAKQAAAFMRALPDPVSARALVGAMPRDERSLALRQYAANTLRMLMLCQVGVEGLNVPPASVLGILQQTKSRTRVAQMVGRVLRPEPGCLQGLDDATAAERREAIARSTKPHAIIRSIAPPDAIEDWETPGRLLWGSLPEPVLIEIDRRQREGKDLETARKEALQAEAEQQAKRAAARDEHLRREAAAAPHRARAVAEAQPYELRDPAQIARDARRRTIASAWERWTSRANAALLADTEAAKATPEQAAAIAKLSCEYLRVPANEANLDRVRSKVLEWDRKTAQAAQHALRCMTGHFRPQARQGKHVTS